jgi:hypothetical protein
LICFVLLVTTSEGGLGDFDRAGSMSTPQGVLDGVALEVVWRAFVNVLK